MSKIINLQFLMFILYAAASVLLMIAGTMAEPGESTVYNVLSLVWMWGSGAMFSLWMYDLIDKG